MMNYGIIGESIGFRVKRIPEQVISGLNLVGARFNSESRAGAFGSGVNLTSIYSIKRFAENPARFFDFIFFYSPLYIAITLLLNILSSALTIRFYS